MRKKGKSFARRVDPLAAFKSADRQHPLDSGQKLQLGVVLRTHLEALRTGHATEAAFHNLASAVNVSMVMAENGGPGSEYSAVIGAAQEAMIRLKVNGNHKGRWLMDGPGLRTAMQWMAIYDAQLEIVSQQEAMNALDEVAKRVRRGLVFEDLPQGATP